MDKYLGSSILSMNSKMKKSGGRVFNFGIPAYKTAEGKLTCPFAKDCIKYCYAQKGTYSWSNVKPAFEKRYKLTKDENFIDIMSKAIAKKKADFLRIHDSGDFYSRDYLNKWVEIAKINSNVKFYFYTKSVKLIQDLIASQGLPENLRAIYSLGGKQDNLVNLETDIHAKIFNSQDELLEAGYTDCSKDDLKIFTTKKVGLIAH